MRHVIRVYACFFAFGNGAIFLAAAIPGCTYRLLLSNTQYPMNSMPKARPNCKLLTMWMGMAQQKGLKEEICLFRVSLLCEPN